MNKFIRTWKVLLFMMLLALTITACASPSGNKDSKEENASAQNNEEEANFSSDEDTLKLLIPNYYNDVEREQWSKVVERFQELHPEIDVELETGDVRVESGGLTSLLQSGINVPDAILMNAGPSRISVLSQGELIQTLDDLYEKNEWKDSLRPFVYDLIAGEKIYEVPHMIDAIAHFYNRELFEEHGLKEPKTPEEYIEILDVLANESDVAPITVGARNGYAIGWLFGVMLEAMAGTEKMEEIIYEDGKWNDPEIIEVAEELVEWKENGYISKDAVTLQETDAKFNFLNKQAGIYTAGTYLITDIAAENLQDNIGFFMAPAFNEGQTSNPTGGIGQSWVIPADATNPDYAEIWLNFILSVDYAEVVYGFEDYNFILASSTSMEVTPVGEVLKQAVENVETDSGYNPSVFVGVETSEAYFQSLQGLVGGLISPEEAMDQIEEAAQKDKENGFELVRNK